MFGLQWDSYYKHYFNITLNNNASDIHILLVNHRQICEQ